MDDGHSDRLIYLNGRNYVRKFNTWEEKQGFTLQIGEENGPQSFVKWEISTISNKKTTLKITVYPYILSKFPGHSERYSIIFGLNLDLKNILILFF